MTVVSTGFIVAVDFTIYGYGRYGHEAIEAFEKNLELQDIKVIDADTDVRVLEFGPRYILQEDIQVMPATAALLDAVREGNNSVMWAKQGEVACLPKEIV
jgi:hypothetical protein